MRIGTNQMNTRSSLGGKNSLGRQSGARSSRASSTIFKQLRKADRRIAELDRWIKREWDYKRVEKLTEQRANWDIKRRELRILRKEQSHDRTQITGPRANRHS